jgi:hypothetical protein
LQQDTTGVAFRMAVLYLLAGQKSAGATPSEGAGGLLAAGAAESAATPTLEASKRHDEPTLSPRR